MESGGWKRELSCTFHSTHRTDPTGREVPASLIGSDTRLSSREGRFLQGTPQPMRNHYTENLWCPPVGSLFTVASHVHKRVCLSFVPCTPVVHRYCWCPSPYTNEPQPQQPGRAITTSFCPDEQPVWGGDLLSCPYSNCAVATTTVFFSFSCHLEFGANGMLERKKKKKVR